MSELRGFVFGLPKSKEFNVLEVVSLLVPFICVWQDGDSALR